MLSAGYRRQGTDREPYRGAPVASSAAFTARLQTCSLHWAAVGWEDPRDSTEDDFTVGVWAVAPNDTQRPKAGPLPKDPEKRRRELQRRKLERQAQLRAQRVAETRKRTLIIGGCVVAVAAIAAGIVAVLPSSKPSKSASADTASSSPSAAANTPAAAKANYTITPKKNEGSWKTEPPMTIDT